MHQRVSPALFSLVFTLSIVPAAFAQTGSPAQPAQSTQAAQPTQPDTPQPAGAQTTAENAPEQVALRLSDHTILVGTIVSEDASTIVLDAGTLGKITLKTSDVVGRIDPQLVASVGAPPPPPASTPEAGVSFFAPPGQKRWVRTLDFQGSFNSALYEQGPVIGVPATGAELGLAGDQYTAAFQLTVLHATNKHSRYVNASYQKAVYEPAGSVTDMPKLSVGYSYRRKDGDRHFYTFVYEWYKDKVRHIDKSHQAFVGVGFHAVHKPKLQLDLVPLVGVLLEEKGTEFDGELLTGTGGLWQLTYAPSAQVQLEHRETFHAAFNDWGYHGLETYVGFKGMLSQKFGLTAGITHTYDNALDGAFLEDPRLPGVRVFANKTTFVKITTGIHIAF